MAQYKIKFTDTGENYKIIMRNQKNTSNGIISTIPLSVVDQDGTAVSLAGLTTSMKIYIGIEGALKVDGGTLEAVGAATLGTVLYRIPDGEYSAAGVYSIQIYCADHATPATATDALTADGCTLDVRTTMTVIA